jgi:hypothetical protein
MVGIRIGRLIVATMAVILALYGVLFVGQGRVPLGLLALLAAAGCAGHVARAYARAAAERRARARERERAFVDSVRRG